MKRYFSFAGAAVCVEGPQEQMFSDAGDLAAFETAPNPDAHRFVFTAVKALTPPRGSCLAVLPDRLVYEDGGGTAHYIGSVETGWQQAYLRAAHHGTQHHCQLLERSLYQGRIGAKAVLRALQAEHLILRAGGVILHASMVEYRGRGIVFTAPSGTGKSTQAELWRSLRGAQIINGDRAALRPGPGGATVCGIPYSGSSGICGNAALPLAAIVYLRQAPVTKLGRLEGLAAFRALWEGCSVNTWDREDTVLAADLVQSLVGLVPVLELACTPDESAVAALEQWLEV